MERNHIQILRHQQVSGEVLPSFLQIQLLPLIPVGFLRVVQDEVRDGIPLRQLTGILHRGVGDFVRMEDVIVGFQAKCLVKEPFAARYVFFPLRAAGFVSQAGETLSRPVL